jgi:hypothetical protein
MALCSFRFGAMCHHDMMGTHFALTCPFFVATIFTLPCFFFFFSSPHHTPPRFLSLSASRLVVHPVMSSSQDRPWQWP